jgi:drug/metabolite transporter (DMT)-like permease
MATFEIAVAILGVVLLAWAVAGTKETAGSRLLAIVISLTALVVAALAAIVFHGEGRR